MKVFVAGATGAVGRPLVRQLVEAGHEVTAMTRSEERARSLREAGAAPVVCDALDRGGVAVAVRAAKPEVVVDQLTGLPQDFNPRKIAEYYRRNNEVRLEGGRNLLSAAMAAGARRMIVQSVSFYYAPNGGGLKGEEDPLFFDAPEPGGTAVKKSAQLEREVMENRHVEGITLRYGFFYGPDTHWAPNGSFGREVRKRRYPIVGGGEGVFSWIQVEDAAAAAVVALDRGGPGAYNIVDDDPAPMHEWLPHYARSVGAKPPRRVPKLVARIAAGPLATWLATETSGASNAKAKRELGWSARFASWREGFEQALG